MHLSVKLLSCAVSFSITVSLSAADTSHQSHSPHDHWIPVPVDPHCERCADHSTDEDACRQALREATSSRTDGFFAHSATLPANSSPTALPLPPLAILAIHLRSDLSNQLRCGVLVPAPTLVQQLVHLTLNVLVPSLCLPDRTCILFLRQRRVHMLAAASRASCAACVAIVGPSVRGTESGPRASFGLVVFIALGPRPGSTSSTLTSSSGVRSRKRLCAAFMFRRHARLLGIALRILLKVSPTAQLPLGSVQRSSVLPFTSARLRLRSFATA